MRAFRNAVVLAVAVSLSAPGSAQAGRLAERVGRYLKLATLRTKAATGRWFAPVVGYVQLLTPFRYPVVPYRARVSAAITRGSRLEAHDVAELRRHGYRAIVSLTAEDVPDAAAARALGMRFLQIPIIDNSIPTREQMKQFLDFVTDPALQPRPGEGPTIYVHCQAGQGRTGMAIAIYRVVVEGWGVGRALAEAHRYGLRLHHQTERVRTLARELKREGSPRAR